MALQLHTPVEIRRKLADRVRALRLDQDLTQATLAKRAGISLPTLQRYEQSGKTSLENVLRICQALGRLDEFDTLLRPARASTLAELEEQEPATPRRRGKR